MSHDSSVSFPDADAQLEAHDAATLLFARRQRRALRKRTARALKADSGQGASAKGTALASRPRRVFRFFRALARKANSGRKLSAKDVWFLNAVAAVNGDGGVVGEAQA